MKLNNSIKLAIANFSLFWKIFLYKIIAFGISLLLFLPVFQVLRQAFASAGFNSAFVNLFTDATFVSMPSLVNNLLSLFNSFIGGITILATSNVFALIYLAIMLLVVVPFLFKISDVPSSECAYSYMSSLNKSSFTINVVSMMGKSVGYSILRSLMEVPFWFAIFGGVYGFLNLYFMSPAMKIITPMLLLIYVIVLFALNTSFFNSWAPSVVVFNLPASKAFGKSIKALKRNFFSVLSSFIVVAVISVALLYLFGIYALIIEIPLIALVNAVFGQVLFFESQGMDYYLGPDKIISTKKLESLDKMKQMKNII